MSENRQEADSMGSIEIPQDKLYGASTQRAIENFPISFKTFSPLFYKSLALLKWACAKANLELGQLEPDIANAIMDVADRIYKGEALEHFVVDIYQTGSGTSTNMNFNEVAANMANLKLGSSVGSKTPIHPNDHVNKGQSSNDVFPTAIHIAVYISVVEELLPNLRELEKRLSGKSEELSQDYKSGRTHLQDATPITLGHEFSGFSRQIALGIKRIESSLVQLTELAIGGTAVGTGINTHSDFGSKVASILKEKTNYPFKEAENHLEAQASKDACVEMSSSLKTLATSLMKIGNDIRWLSSGPRAGIGEIILPAVQPGSSIMPGKVNPVIAESLTQVCAKVMGNDVTITIAGQSGNFELNVMMPLIADSLLESVSLLAHAVQVFSEKCIIGLMVNKEQCKRNIERNLIISTALVPYLGYDLVATLTKEAYERDLSIRDIVLEKRLMHKTMLDKVLDIKSMI